MADLSRRSRWLMFGGALLLGWWLLIFEQLEPLFTVATRWFQARETAFRTGLVWEAWRNLDSLGPGLLVASTVAAALIVVARIVMRARLRRDGVDGAAAVAARLEAHPRLVRGGAATIAAMVAVGFAVHRSHWNEFIRGGSPLWLALHVVGGVMFIAAATRIAHALQRALVAPLLDRRPDEQEPGAGAQLAFQAVAVTPEARAEVAVVSLVTLVGAALAASLPFETLVDNRALAGGLVYVALVAAAASEFQRASRIAVGNDGILVSGTSRTRFFGYHEVDGAEGTERGEIALRRGDAVVLRLQLHGDDAMRRDELLARIRGQIARAAALAGGQAHQLAQAASPADLARAARGGGDYRAAGTSRDDLWQVIEAPIAAAERRRAAAEALAVDLDDHGRGRLRVAGELCADPTARQALLRIADGEPPTDDEAEEELAAGEAAGAREVPPPRAR